MDSSDTCQPGPSTDEELSVSSEGLLIDDLPNELLLGILRRADSKSLNNITCVSKRWRAIVNEVIGRKIFVGRQCQFVPHDNSRYIHTYVDISEISKVGIRECFVGEVVDAARSMTLWNRLFSAIKKAIFGGTDFPEFKFPFLLHTIHFDGPIPALCFDSLLKDTVNLSRLEVHVTAFCNVSPASLQTFGQRMKHLKEVSIWGHKLTDGLFTEFHNPQPIVPNMVAFLSNSFQSLTFFGLEYPFDIRDDKSLTRELFEFLKRHHVKLKTLRICVNIPITDETSEFDTFEDRDWVRESRLASRQMNLTVLELIVSSMRRVRLTKVWMAFVEHQRDLRRATILSFRVPISLLITVCQNNIHTLEALFVSRILMTNGVHAVSLDGSVFAPCGKLTQLTVEGMLHNGASSGLTSARLFPRSLVKLEIGGMLIEQHDSHDLFFELPNLTHICLTDTGNRGLYGVNMNTVRAVIEAKRISVVSLYRCICGPFPESGIPNGDPNRRYLIRQRPYDILEMKLNPDGYYENNYRNAFVVDNDEDL